MDEELAKRFWVHVEKGSATTQCWKWTGKTTYNGYGLFSYKGARSASRVSYEIHSSPIPRGMLVCHTCDNPPCTNPKHLWLGTPRDNSLDASRKGRLRNPSHGRRRPRLYEDRLSPAELVVEVFGGVTEVARIVGRSPAGVSIWCLPKAKSGLDGEIPMAVRCRIIDVAKERGIALTIEELFYGRKT